MADICPISSIEQRVAQTTTWLLRPAQDTSQPNSILPRIRTKLKHRSTLSKCCSSLSRQKYSLTTSSSNTYCYCQPRTSDWQVLGAIANMDNSGGSREGNTSPTIASFKTDHSADTTVSSGEGVNTYLAVARLGTDSSISTVSKVTKVAPFS